MRTYLLEGLGVLCVMLASIAQAASFTPVHESTYCNSDALTRADVQEPNEFTDPYDVWNPNFNATESVTYIEVQPDEFVVANSETEMFISIATSGETFTDNNIQLYSNSYSYVEITTPKGEEAYAWGGAATVDLGYATGNFYEITPEAGESTGDWVTVTVDYYAYIGTMSEGGSSTSAIVDGGWAGNDLLITRNCADYDDPQPGEIAGTFEKQEFDGEHNDQITFSARIGDIIGIHGGVYTNAYTGTNPGSAQATANLSLYLTLSEGTGPVWTAADADIDGSGFVDLGDLAILAQFWLQTVIQ